MCVIDGTLRESSTMRKYYPYCAAFFVQNRFRSINSLGPDYRYFGPQLSIVGPTRYRYFRPQVSMPWSQSIDSRSPRYCPLGFRLRQLSTPQADTSTKVFVLKRIFSPPNEIHFLYLHHCFCNNGFVQTINIH